MNTLAQWMGKAIDFFLKKKKKKKLQLGLSARFIKKDRAPEPLAHTLRIHSIPILYLYYTFGIRELGGLTAEIAEIPSFKSQSFRIFRFPITFKAIATSCHGNDPIN